MPSRNSSGASTSVPGSALGKGNVFRDRSAEERERIVEEFRALQGSYQDRERRIEVMDAQGIETAIMFPTGVGVGIWSNNWHDPEANIANVRAYNRWVDDTWGFDTDGRIVSPAAVGLLDLDAGLAEVDRCIAAGARTLLLPPGPLYDRAPGDPYYDGLWARLHESGVRAVIHLGYTRYQVAGKYYGYDPDTHYFDGFDAFQWLNYWGDRPIMETISSLIFDNLFTRFPRLQIGIIEHGAVYLPYLLQEDGPCRPHGEADAPRCRSTGARARCSRSTSWSRRIPRRTSTASSTSSDPTASSSAPTSPTPRVCPTPSRTSRQLEHLPETTQRAIMRDNLAALPRPSRERRS